MDSSRRASTSLNAHVIDQCVGRVGAVVVVVTRQREDDSLAAIGGEAKADLRPSAGGDAGLLQHGREPAVLGHVIQYPNVSVPPDGDSCTLWLTVLSPLVAVIAPSIAE